MSSTYSNLLFHVVFSTEGREPYLSQDLIEELGRFASKLLTDEGARILVLGGVEDHVHALVVLKPKHCLADLVRTLKANTSRWLKTKVSPSFAWQRGYSAFSVSHSMVSTVCRYIERQEEHHRAKSYREEILAFLSANEIQFEEQYLVA